MKLLSKLAEHLRRRLIQSDELEKTDLIFVLAGHTNRKVYGAQLFRNSQAPRLLMSTGSPAYIARVLEREVPREVLRNPQVWAQIRDTAARAFPPDSQFFASLDSGKWSVESILICRLGTLSEIQALARWLELRSSIHSLMIVSSGMHLRRVKMCCRRLLPSDLTIRLIAVPATASELYAPGERPPREDLSRVLLEWFKVALYSGIFLFSTKRNPPAATFK